MKYKKPWYPVQLIAMMEVKEVKEVAAVTGLQREIGGFGSCGGGKVILRVCSRTSRVWYQF